MATSPHPVRRVLYFAGRRRLPQSFLSALAGLPGCHVGTRHGRPFVTCPEAAYQLAVCHDVASAHALLHREYFNLVLLDLRDPVDRPSKGRGYERGLALLDAMDRELDIERRYGFHRVLVLVSGGDAVAVDERIARLGARGVGRVMRDLSTCHLNPSCQHLPSESDFAARVLSEVKALTLQPRSGKRALCASGGGITGLYFELGALKCLEDCCAPGTLNSFDLYFGISAGSVATGLLANGYTVTEFMAAIAGERGGRIDPLELSLLDRAHLDLGALFAPLRQLAALVGRGALELLRGRLPLTGESLVFEYADLFHAPFRTDGYEALLRRAFTRRGCTNDFRKLKHPLFVGATDQDLKQHVLFGAPPHDGVPISRAIQASMSLNPAFAATEIDGRFYEDGAVTRTSNFGDAIARGADLIFTFDPIVPYVSERPGFARRRGVFYNADQDIRCVSFTRYETTRNWALRRHPEVSLYTFLPPNNLRKVLSVNPMDHRPYLEVWRGAYLGTLKRLHRLGYRLRGDLAAHGIRFDTAPADAVAERLAATHAPRFADFFPDGRVVLRAPRPAAEQPSATRVRPRLVARRSVA